MHEYGIARELVSEVERNVRAHAGVRASRVVVAVSPGALEEESLRVAFDTVRVDTVAARAELAVEHVALDAYCLDCAGELHVDDVAGFRCPECGSERWRPVGTPGVLLRSVEIEI